MTAADPGIAAARQTSAFVIGAKVLCMAQPGECISCTSTAAGTGSPLRERLLVTQHWRVAHAFGTAVPGWLVVLPTEHVETLAELSPGAAEELGPLLRDLTAALHEAVGSVKTYVALFAEAEGFHHVHFHVIPRMVDQPEALRGPRVFAALGGEQRSAVSAEEMDRLAQRIREKLPVQFGS